MSWPLKTKHYRKKRQDGLEGKGKTRMGRDSAEKKRALRPKIVKTRRPGTRGPLKQEGDKNANHKA